MTVSETDRSARDLLAELRARYPDAPFLALGQTVFWDEPVKAVLRCLLDEYQLGGQMLPGVHDTDYFAKTRVRQPGRGRFALLPHNDGTTKELWSAAGEISTLFGSETFPGRHDYAHYGVAFERLAKAQAEGRQAFLDEMTEAWGWRGLVYTGSRDLIVNRLPLREVGEGILEMLAWGFDNAVCQIKPFCCQHEARRIADTILGWCQEYLRENPDKYLTDLFQNCLPRFYELLIGHAPENVTVSSTSRLLRFAPDTAHLPRFRFVNLFLDPATRDTALAAYNQAVAGSEIYTLDKFGAGALPFDVIIPGRGRGTLRITPRVVFVETRQPVAIGLKKPVESLQELAELLSRKLGDQIILVGKAVSLVSMLAQEFIFVFNEEGSLYVRRTRQMNDTLIKKGIPLDMRPILRMRYHTWDSLVVGTSTLCLPEHLTSVFGRACITAPEFGASWRQVVEEQQVLCEQLAQCRKPLDLLAFLQERQPVAAWDECRAAYQSAQQKLLELRTQAEAVQARINDGYRRLRALRAESQQSQKAKGDHFRSVTDWTAEEKARRAGWDKRLHDLESQKRALLAEICVWKQERWNTERGEEAKAARAIQNDIENRAGLARLQLVRSALLAIKGLPHTNHRPSAWWIPMLDRTGELFRRMVATTELYTEPLVS